VRSLAKKTSFLAKSSVQAILGVSGAAIAIIIVAPLLIPDFPINVYGEIINPPFEEPSELTTAEEMLNNAITINIPDQIEEILCGGEGSGEAPFEDIEGVIEEEGIIPCSQIEDDESGEETQKEIEELDDGVIENPPPTNQTEFSEDPPIEQVCDVDPTNIICQIADPTSATLNILSKVTKIDSAGNIEIVEDTFGISQLAFFVEDISNIDYSTGFLEIELFLKSTDPQLDYDGVGEHRINFVKPVGNVIQISPPVDLVIQGTSDNEGIIPIQFIGPTGILSNKLTFSFEDNIDKFPNEQVQELNLFLVSLDVTETNPNITCITAPCNPIVNEFSLSQTLSYFTMDIARDDIQIIIVDENTNATSRVFPTDSRLVLTTVSKSISGFSCKIGHIPDFGTRTGCAAVGASCTVGWVLANGCLSGGTVFVGTNPPPLVQGLTLLDQNGQLLFNKPGGTGKIFDELLTRNENYTFLVSAFPPSELSYGKAQETQSYTCSSQGSVSYVITRVAGPPHLADRCGGGGCYYNYYIRPTGFSPGVTQCNLP